MGVVVHAMKPVRLKHSVLSCFWYGEYENDETEFTERRLEEELYSDVETLTQPANVKHSIFGINQIQDHALIIPYLDSSKFFLEIQPFEEWGSLFLDLD